MTTNNNDNYISTAAKSSSSSSSIIVDSDTAQAFVAGALLPTIAYYFLWRRRRQEHAARLAAAAAAADDDDDSDYDSDDSNDDFVKHEPAGTRLCSEWGLAHAPYKMVLCVNTELSMGKGKVAAQVGHAAVGCYQAALKKCPHAVKAWERTGCAKIALKCPTTQELERVAAAAVARDIPMYLVVDAGRTQIAAGSRTVVGLLGPTTVFEGVTDHLKLM